MEKREPATTTNRDRLWWAEARALVRAGSSLPGALGVSQITIPKASPVATSEALTTGGRPHGFADQ